MIEKKNFGVTADGSVVEQYTVTNKNGVSASFITLGGIWTSMNTPDKNGQFEDVVLGCDSVDAVLKNGGHLGEIVGRNANRIAGAKFSLNGVSYELKANNGPNNLHSGPDFYRNRIWKAEAKESKAEAKVSFYLNSPDGDQGYPGNADIRVSYTLTQENELKIEYHMTCDADTVANFTNHAYFNLAGHKSGNAMNQLVWIDADFFTPMDENSIPLGSVVSVRGTPMDFTEMKPISRELEAEDEQLKLGNGYDHNWVLNHEAGKLALSAKAMDHMSGRMLEVYTDLPGMQFYTANFLNSEIPAKEGVKYQPREAYCFETQYYPDAVNQPQFPSPILKAGEEYHSTTIYKFAVCA